MTDSTLANLLTTWERGRLAMHAASQALTYAGHYADAGLFRGEVAEMNRWRALSAKLNGEPAPEPMPYRGTRRNGFNPEAD